MAQGSHDQIKKKIQVSRFFFSVILGLVAQRLKVLARQEAPAVCIVLEVLEATWCLLWDYQWEVETYQPAGHFHSCLLEAFALFQSDSYRIL